MAAQLFSAVMPGSEFWPAALLAPLLSAHPLWPHFNDQILEGAEFPLLEISDADRLDNIRDKEEVERGWQLLLPREAALKINGCEVAPLGMVAQTSIDKNGQIIEKFRLTHDQLFNPSGMAGRSVNDRVDMSQ